MSHHDVLSVAAASADDVRPRDVLTQVLREIAGNVLLPDPERLSGESEDQDPLSPEGLALQTDRLLVLIKRAKEREDATLLRSLRRELLATRYALVQSSGVPSHLPQPGSGQAPLCQARGAVHGKAETSFSDTPSRP